MQGCGVAANMHKVHSMKANAKRMTKAEKAARVEAQMRAAGIWDYWKGSITASVEADHKAGNVVVLNADANKTEDK